MSGAEVRGRCAPAFESLRRTLADSIDAGREVGAALSVYVGQESVVDLWAGHRDAARTRPWDESTIVNLYSVGKAVTAVCALRLVEDGSLDLDAPVSRYWPEFGQGGKDRVSVRHLLTHQAGLPAVFRELPPGAVPTSSPLSPARTRPSAGRGSSSTRPPSRDSRGCARPPIETRRISRGRGSSTRASGGPPRSRRPMATAPPAPSHGSTRRSRPTGRWTGCTFSPRGPSRRRWPSTRTERTSCSRERRASGWDSSWPCRPGPSDRTRAPSVTSGPGARSDSPTPT